MPSSILSICKNNKTSKTNSKTSNKIKIIKTIIAVTINSKIRKIRDKTINLRKIMPSLPPKGIMIPTIKTISRKHHRKMMANKTKIRIKKTTTPIKSGSRHRKICWMKTTPIIKILTLKEL